MNVSFWGQSGHLSDIRKRAFSGHIAASIAIGPIGIQVQLVQDYLGNKLWENDRCER
jgi:hypothetical protein